MTYDLISKIWGEAWGVFILWPQIVKLGRWHIFKYNFCWPKLGTCTRFFNIYFILSLAFPSLLCDHHCLNTSVFMVTLHYKSHSYKNSLMILLDLWQTYSLNPTWVSVLQKKCNIGFVKAQIWILKYRYRRQYWPISLRNIIIKSR